MAGLDPAIADLAGRFVLLRLTRMRGIDLDRFDFDYDLTWMGFFLAADGRILGRYGGRDASGPDSRLSLAGLRQAMRRALERHAAGNPPPVPAAERRTPRTVDELPGARRLPAGACIHCHQVYDFRREDRQARGLWRRDEVWVYPLPETLGFTLAIDEGDRVVAVRPDSPAARAGLRRGDRLTTVSGRPVASIADVQYALHRAPATGRLTVAWQRDGRALHGEMPLPPGWRQTDLSWRWSLRGVDPPPWVVGDDLSAAQKQTLGLQPTRLALRQGPFVSEPARQAGIRQGDIVLGVDGKMLALTAAQFAAHIRLTYRVGDRVTYHLLRDGERIDVTLRLRGRTVAP